MNIKWKNLSSFVTWCQSHPADGKTLNEIALEYLGLNLPKISNRFIRKYYQSLVRSHVVNLKQKVKDDKDIPFISNKEFVRKGEVVFGYGSLVPEGAEQLYMNTTNRMVEGIRRNQDLLRENKKRLGKK